jgi:hypothetical protein
VRPRVTLGAALTLGSYLLLAPLPYFLLPLSLLLLLGRRDRLIVWIILGGSALVTGVWLAGADAFAVQVLKGWGVVTAGTFVAWAVPGRRRPIDAAILAALTGGITVSLWLLAAGSGLEAVVREVLRTLSTTLGDVERSLPESPGDLTALFALFFPVFTMLLGVAGLLLAWTWAHLLASPDEPPPALPFTAFTFSDHFVWVLIVGVAGTVAQIAGRLDPALLWPATLVGFTGGLYALRGLAVVRATVMGGRPLGVLLLLLLAPVVLFLLPFVVSGLLGVGLADTWFDFRRRAADARGE